MITFKFCAAHIMSGTSIFITIDAESYGKAREYLYEQLLEGYGYTAQDVLTDLINPDDAAKAIYENAKYLLD